MYIRVGNINQVDTVTVTEAANILGITKEEVKDLANQGIFQKIGETEHQYVLLKSEVERTRK